MALSLRVRTACFLGFGVILANPISHCLPQKSSPTAQVQDDVVARQKLESAVAKLFEDTRSASGLTHLSRIKDRTLLERLVCTVALSGKPLTPDNMFPGVLYQTKDVTAKDPKFLRLAQFDDSHSKGNPRITRYAVAVWPVADESKGYWIGMSLYFGVANEIIVNTFTDTRSDKSIWSKKIAPECSKIR